MKQRTLVLFTAGFILFSAVTPITTHAQNSGRVDGCLSVADCGRFGGVNQGAIPPCSGGAIFCSQYDSFAPGAPQSPTTQTPPASSGGSACHCTGTITANALVPNSTFDAFCPSMQSACSSCGGGRATCAGDFALSTQDCQQLNSNPQQIGERYGVPAAAFALVSIQGTCTGGGLTSAAPSTAGSGLPTTGSLPPAASNGNTPANTPAPAPGYGLINPLGTRSIPQIIGGAVGWLGGLAGGLFFMSLIWGGIVWMTAGGSEEKVKAGQKRIVSSMIGIAIVLLSYMIVSTIIGVVPRAV